MFIFNNWFWDRLSTYFQDHDTYKDGQGEGILQRYLKIFGEDLDEVVLPLMLDYIKIVDPLESKDFAGNILDPAEADDDKFLNHIAYSLGNPIDPTKDEYYRKVLQFAISLNKIKGTIPAYEIWANMIGVEITIFELATYEAKYDSGFAYDTVVLAIMSEEQITFDSACPTCSDYVIAVDGLSTLTEEKLRVLNEIVQFNEPINAKLRDIIPRFYIEETIPKCMVEEINIKIVEGGFYDDGLSLYDEFTQYDKAVISSEQTIHQLCELGGSGFDTVEFDAQEFDNN